MSCIETVGVLVDKDWSKAEMDGEAFGWLAELFYFLARLSGLQGLGLRGVLGGQMAILISV